jgi:protein involved in polysaccharide export with SLBB domain
MKNLVPKDGLAARWAAMKYLTPLLAVLFTLTGCKTDQHADLSPQASSQRISKSSEPSHSESITLREGDVVNITFPTSTSLNTTQQIRRDGKIVMPLIGEVTAAGMTPTDLQTELIKLYKPQVELNQVTVTVQSSSITVYITGAVLRPGPVAADHPLSALEAVMEAGGFDYTKANLKDVVVIRQEKDRTVRYTLNLKKALAGSQGEPFYLKPSDIVYVPERFTWF